MTKVSPHNCTFVFPNVQFSTMGKDNTKNLVEQPIFKQMIKMLPHSQFDLLVREHGSDRYYKTFFSWELLLVMLFGILSQGDSMGKVYNSIRALAGKLNHLNMDCSPSKNTVEDALRNSSEELFKQYYLALITYFHLFLSVSRKKYVSFKRFYAFDSSSITLFSDVMKGTSCNPKGEGEKKAD